MLNDVLIEIGFSQMSCRAALAVSTVSDQSPDSSLLIKQSTGMSTPYDIIVNVWNVKLHADHRVARVISSMHYVSNICLKGEHRSQNIL